ncbi:O-antigen ligase family protein [Bdellovibrio sp. 22V]|uniref:O-antigen ligase family protein n=1 Tax=Bdellovibrio sp. 22V TaxID=3044166 RepID=UPI0025434B7B|nr:O-antigen ligase family protein [Bdellovibrio sp. 22V]WII71834.1 O-antigen ligase family protein [Bdellovibrio sp. 22V]
MVAIIAHYFLMPENPQYFGYPNRLQGTFTNINFLAHSYFLVFLLVLGLFITHFQNNQKRLAVLLGITVFTISSALFLTFTRTIWVAMILSLPIMLVLVNKKTAVKTFFASCLIFGALFITDVGGTRERVLQTLSTNPGDAIRITLWRTSVKIFRDNPIMGVGYMNNKRDIMKYFEMYGEKDITAEFDTHPHNEILSFLAGTGFVGAILYVGNFVLFFLLGLKTLKIIPNSETIKRGLLLGAITIQPAFLIAGFADNNFEIHVARNWLVISWAILIWLATENNTTVTFDFKRRPR